MNRTIYNIMKLQELFEELKKLKLPFNFSFEEIKQIKTKKQLGFIWGILLPDLTNYFNQEGQTIEDKEKPRKWTAEDSKLWIYHNTIGLQYKILPDGSAVPYIKTMSEMSKEELSEFINKAIDLIDSETDCILRPTVRTCWLHHVTDYHWQVYDAHDFEEETNYNSFLIFQRSKPCLYCGKSGTVVHHIKDVKYSGTATKSPDWYTIPLCHEHHQELHNGKPILNGLAIYNYDLEQFCKLNYLKWLYKL